MPKLPYMQFFTGDWMKDPKLSMCLPATRGIWIDALCAMHEDGRSGTLVGTPDQLIRVLRCDESALRTALNDLATTGAADITERNGVITLVNRRMKRDANDREVNNLRQSRYRERHRGNGENDGSVTAMSQPSGSEYEYVSSDSFKKKRESEGKEKLSDRFDSFWSAYPRKEAKQNAWKSFQRLNPDDELMSVMIPWIGRACESEQWQDKSKIPHPATWLNQRRWEGDPPPPPKNQGQAAFGERRNDGGNKAGNQPGRNPRSGPKYDPRKAREMAGL